MYGRWLETAICENQIDPDIQPVIWEQIMRFDTLGSTWGTPPWNPIASPEGGLMRTRRATYWGWNEAAAAKVQAPSLCIAGEQDWAQRRVDLYDALGTDHKVLIQVACATHFLLWENRHKILLKTSKDWFLHGSIKGVRNGFLYVDSEGKFHKE
jgi:pimeloyl-ACP methyl ester carboxylesterase